MGGEDRVKSLMDLGLPKETPKSVIIREYQEIVIGDFENIGSLISNKLVPKEAFLHAHWTTILYSWAALKDDIIAEGKKEDTYIWKI